MGTGNGTVESKKSKDMLSENRRSRKASSIISVKLTDKIKHRNHGDLTIPLIKAAWWSSWG